jgi:hypothetical protein
MTILGVFWMRSFLGCLCLLPCLALASARTGAEIYREACAKCHGPKGEGVADKHDEPLYGDRSLPSLTRYIDRAMPEDDPDLLNAEESAKVASYIFNEFYSPQARARVRPARLELSRLTVPQYLNAAADLVASFRPSPKLDEKRGLTGQYHNARNVRRNKKVFERIDPAIDFDFGQGSPTNSIGTNEFAIRWRGSIIAEGTGDYEFRIKTENGARLWVNNERKALIDAWVSSGGEVREHKETIRLLGGRAYPIQLDYFKYKDKTASLVLEWKAPHKAWQTIPEAHLSPTHVPEVMVVTASFPADDRSVGYERGTAVSKAWDQAATRAAIEVAGQVVEDLESLSGVKADTPHRDIHMKLFCEKLAERAFRRPLSVEERRFFIRNPFGDGEDVEGAVKRVVLLLLKSPRFLYPGLGETRDYAVASRLSFALWDSLPDPALLDAAASGKLQTSQQIAAQAERMLADPRTKTKVRQFFEHWLEMEEAEDMQKDTTAYPDFNEAVVADLRTSLELFLDDVVWSEQSDYRQLLLADYLFANERLAKFYGLPKNGGGEFEKVATDRKQRTGVLTHPYLLSAFAYHKSSSPIHRGVFLTRNIVGRSLKPPPMAIEFMDGRFDPSLTMREKVAELTRPAACAGCHSVINPLGFSLEHFDAVGRYRTTENKKPIDAASEYTTSEGETIRISGARDVAEYAAASEEAQRGFVRQLFQQLAKQAPDAYGPKTLDTLREGFAASNFNIRKLIIEITTTAAMHADNNGKGT